MTTLTRRAALGSGAAAIFATGFFNGGSAAKAAAPKAGRQVVGAYRTRVGEAEVTAILDGYIDVLPEWFVNTPEPVLRSALQNQFLDPNKPLRISVNAFLINTGSRLIAIDAGADTFFGPPAGRYAVQLSAVGIDPGAVDDVVLTHMHPDHIGGMIAGGQAVFPNAQVHVNAIEHNYWLSSTERSRAPDFARPWFDAVATLTTLYDGKINAFLGEAEVLPGLTSVPLHGHTPGHTGFVLESGSDRLFFWADITDFVALQLNNPERTLIFDVDKNEGEKARRKGIEMAASEQMQIAGSHVPFPGLGYVGREGNGYRYVTAEWRHEI